MEALWLGIALVFGLIAQRFSLAPLVGFLTAGFILHALGEKGGPILEGAANYGVLLLLIALVLAKPPASIRDSSN